MPELPEVETTVRRLKKLVVGKTIKDFWTDWPKYLKRPKSKNKFTKNVVGKKVLDVRRTGKNVVFDLSDGYILVVHQKMSGHFLVGKWREPPCPQREKIQKKTRNNTGRTPEKWEGQKWMPMAPKSSPLWDPKNRFIRLIFFLSGGRMLALSDLRRFAKVLCGPYDEITNLPDLKNIGPDSLGSDLTFKKFEELFKNKRGRIKQVLMDQTFIAGIGNIYSDEILWKAKIHPLVSVEKLDERKLGTLYRAVRGILKKALQLQGTSIDDYREPEGKKGKYADVRYVYQREEEKCRRGDGGIIKRIKIGGRSAHFCPKCQKH